MSICCVALHLSSLRRTQKVRLIPRDLRALPLEHFTKLLKYENGGHAGGMERNTIITPPLIAMVPFRVEGQGAGEDKDYPPPLNPRPPGAGKCFGVNI